MAKNCTWDLKKHWGTYQSKKRLALERVTKKLMILVGKEIFDFQVYKLLYHVWPRRLAYARRSHHLRLLPILAKNLLLQTVSWEIGKTGEGQQWLDGYLTTWTLMPAIQSCQKINILSQIRIKYFSKNDHKIGVGAAALSPLYETNCAYPSRLSKNRSRGRSPYAYFLYPSYIRYATTVSRYDD